MGSLSPLQPRGGEARKAPNEPKLLPAESFLDEHVGPRIRINRIRAGMTQKQLASTISRSGKFLSEVETGKARISERELRRLAAAMGTPPETLLSRHTETDNVEEWQLRRRIREPQLTGLAVSSLDQLLHRLDRAGWLRSSNLWMIGAEPFIEESDVALVEQMASLVSSKAVSLRYVFPADRIGDSLSDGGIRQGSVECLPAPLLRAFQWTTTMKPFLTGDSDRVIGYRVGTPMHPLCHSHHVLWIETDDVSWSEVMPLVYCRATTRLFENPNAASAFWYHLPRDTGSSLLMQLAQQLQNDAAGSGSS